MKQVQLTGGFVALIDDEDFERVTAYNWFYQISKCKTRVYAVTNIDRKLVSMQNFILGRKKGFMVDHKIGEGLDNRKDNLRYLTRSQNTVNARLKKNNKSGYTGVLYVERIKKYEVAIKVNRKNIRIGYYEKFEDAKSARIAAEEKYFPGINKKRNTPVVFFEPEDRMPNRKWRSSHSKYKGVQRVKSTYKSSTYIYWASCLNRERLGLFKNEKDAAKAYIAKFKELHGYEPYKINE